MFPFFGECCCGVGGVEKGDEFAADLVASQVEDVNMGPWGILSGRCS